MLQCTLSIIASTSSATQKVQSQSSESKFKPLNLFIKSSFRSEDALE